jgi:4-amino-4-deoxy-L-arabinose transferase-like glycosyltransferase
MPKVVARWLEALSLLAILTLAAYLRLANRVDNPGWHSDEGTIINIADNLLHGRMQYLAITQSTLISARMPLYPALLAGLSALLGEGIGTLRLLSGGLGVLSVGLVYAIVRQMKGACSGLLAALLFAIYPNAILYSRLGFSYNLLTPLALVAYWGLWKYLADRRKRWLAMAALSIGVGITSDVMMLTLALPFSIVILARRWRDLFWSVPLLALPLAAYTGLMLLIAPQAFLFDVNFISNALGAVPLVLQPIAILINYAALLMKDSWLVAGIIGLFLLQPLRLQRLTLLMFWLPLMGVARSAVGLADLSYRYITPLLPFVAIGLAALLEVALPLVARTFADGLAALAKAWNVRLPKSAATVVGGIAMFGVIMSPFLVSTFLLMNEVQHGFRTPLDAIMIDPAEARAVSDFVNAQAGPADLVIGSPAAVWPLYAQVADFQVALAAVGHSALSLPGNLPPDRFAFDARYTRAKFVIVDRVWRNWAALNMPEVAAMLQDVQTWPLAFQAGEMEVYRNPAH